MNLNNNTQTQTPPITPKLSAGGFSLIELMVAMTIGLVIVAAVVQIFVRSHSTYQLDEGLSRVQESARFTMDYLSKDFRMAGYLGCNSALFSTSAVKNNVTPSSETTVFASGGIRGYRYACTTGCSGALSEWQPNLPVTFFGAGEVRTGSDVVIIYRGSDLDTSLDGNLFPENGNLQIKNTVTIAGQIATDDVLMVSDCKGADIFRATSVSSGTGQLTISHAVSGVSGNSTPMLSKPYMGDARLMKLVSRAYYVANSNVADPASEPGLFSKELGSAGLLLAGQQLVGGMESMKILYGVDTAATGSAARYVVPTDVTDWTKVVSVRLGVIVRTPGTVDAALDTNTYNLLDDTGSLLDDFGPVNDTRRRRVFNTTIRVRNH